MFLKKFLVSQSNCVFYVVCALYLTFFISEVGTTQMNVKLQSRGKRDVDILASCDFQCVDQEKAEEYDLIMEYDYEEDSESSDEEGKTCGYVCRIVDLNKTGEIGPNQSFEVVSFSEEPVEENKINSLSESTNKITDSDVIVGNGLTNYQPLTDLSIPVTNKTLNNSFTEKEEKLNVAPTEIGLENTNITTVCPEHTTCKCINDSAPFQLNSTITNKNETEELLEKANVINVTFSNGTQPRSFDTEQLDSEYRSNISTLAPSHENTTKQTIETTPIHPMLNVNTVIPKFLRLWEIELPDIFDILSKSQTPKYHFENESKNIIPESETLLEPPLTSTEVFNSTLMTLDTLEGGVRQYSEIDEEPPKNLTTSNGTYTVTTDEHLETTNTSFIAEKYGTSSTLYESNESTKQPTLFEFNINVNINGEKVHKTQINKPTTQYFVNNNSTENSSYDISALLIEENVPYNDISQFNPSNISSSSIKASNESDFNEPTPKLDSSEIYTEKQKSDYMSLQNDSEILQYLKTTNKMVESLFHLVKALLPNVTLNTKEPTSASSNTAEPTGGDDDSAVLVGGLIENKEISNVAYDRVEEVIGNRSDKSKTNHTEESKLHSNNGSSKEDTIAKLENPSEEKEKVTVSQKSLETKTLEKNNSTTSIETDKQETSTNIYVHNENNSTYLEETIEHNITDTTISSNISLNGLENSTEFVPKIHSKGNDTLADDPQDENRLSNSTESVLLEQKDNETLSFDLESLNNSTALPQSIHETFFGRLNVSDAKTEEDIVKVSNETTTKENGN